jgi:hypothetical protein
MQLRLTDGNQELRHEGGNHAGCSHDRIKNTFQPRLANIPSNMFNAKVYMVPFIATKALD